MSSPTKSLLYALLLIVFSSASLFADEIDNSSKEFNVLDKLSDKYYLDFTPVGKVELPRIFIDDDGVSFYGSTKSALKSGKYVDSYYIDNNEAVVDYPVSYYLQRTDGTATKVDLSLTTYIVYFWLAGGLLFFLLMPLAKRYNQGIGTTTEPKGAFQNIMETFVVFIRDDIALNNIGEKKYLKFTPYLITAFFMILFMNMFGLMPWGVSPTADITVTAALAITTFVVTQFNGTKDHWKHVFWFPGVPAWIRVILTPVEIIGLFTKPFALAIRLFANMASGKVLIYSIIGLIFTFAIIFGDGVAYGTSWVWILFALFIYVIKTVVAFLQAYVFTMLSALFIGMAVEEHDHHHEHDTEHEHVQEAEAHHAHS